MHCIVSDLPPVEAAVFGQKQLLKTQSQKSLSVSVTENLFAGRFVHSGPISDVLFAIQN